MKIYNYYKETFEFLNESIADKSPLEKDVYFIPAYATNKVPLKKKEGFALVFNEENQLWKQIVDYRNKTVYDKNTKEEIIVNYLGELKENHTFKKPNTLFDEFLNNEWITNQEKYNEYLLNEFRKERDKLLLKVDFYQLALVYTELTDIQKEQLKKYRTELLNSTKTQTLPAKPNWFK